MTQTSIGGTINTGNLRSATSSFSGSNKHKFTGANNNPDKTLTSADGKFTSLNNLKRM